MYLRYTDDKNDLSINHQPINLSALYSIVHQTTLVINKKEIKTKYKKMFSQRLKMTLISQTT